MHQAQQHAPCTWLAHTEALRGKERRQCRAVCVVLAALVEPAWQQQLGHTHTALPGAPCCQPTQPAEKPRPRAAQRNVMSSSNGARFALVWLTWRVSAGKGFIIHTYIHAHEMVKASCIQWHV